MLPFVKKLFGHAMCAMRDLSSPTRDQTHAPCSGSAESQPLDGQGSPRDSASLLRNPLNSFDPSKLPSRRGLPNGSSALIARVPGHRGWF